MTEPGDRSLWLVDGYNVLRVSLAPREQDDDASHTWWSEARRDLLEERARCLDEPLANVWLVFDARHLDAPQIREPQSDPAPDAAGAEPAPRIRVVFAPSADEWIVRATREEASRWGEIVVVTADRALAGRARHRGARHVSTADFVARCRS